jgi:protein gp37
MAETSKIEWTDASWTPIRARLIEIQNDGSGKQRIGWHCEHVSEGCRNCYAEGINRRLGTGEPFKPGVLRNPRKGYHGSGIDRPELFLDEKMLTAPLRWKRPRMIFVCSMTDLFADFVSDDMIDRVFAVMALGTQHTFQVLTKRTERMRAYMQTALGRVADRVIEMRETDICRRAGMGPSVVGPLPNLCPGARWWPLRNVWLGVSVEDQATADERIPDLLATPATVRFVSYEPALQPVDFSRCWLHRMTLCGDCPSSDDGSEIDCPCADERIDWIIAGGESGPHARPAHPDWFRSVRDQCAAGGVPFFFKQWGEWIDERLATAQSCAPGPEMFDVYGRPKGPRWHFYDQDDWLGGAAIRVGKKAAGRLLDGVTHDGFPEAAG